MPGRKNLCAFLTLAMTATLFAGCSGNSDSSDSTSSVATKDSTSSDKTLKVAVFDMQTLYLMQTFNDMGILRIKPHYFILNKFCHIAQKMHNKICNK